MEALLDACYEVGYSSDYDSDAAGASTSNDRPSADKGGSHLCRPAILCSVRDILVTRSARDHKWAADKIQSHFDTVLVHGDKRIVPFSETFPLFHHIQDKVKYTGYVVDSMARSSKSAHLHKGVFQNLVLISAGGGGSGDVALFYTAAIEAAEKMIGFDFVIRVGPCVPRAVVDILQTRAASILSSQVADLSKPSSSSSSFSSSDPLRPRKVCIEDNCDADFLVGEDLIYR